MAAVGARGPATRAGTLPAAGPHDRRQLVLRLPRLARPGRRRGAARMAERGRVRQLLQVPAVDQFAPSGACPNPDSADTWAEGDQLLQQCLAYPTGVVRRRGRYQHSLPACLTPACDTAAGGAVHEVRGRLAPVRRHRQPVPGAAGSVPPGSPASPGATDAAAGPMSLCGAALLPGMWNGQLSHRSGGVSVALVSGYQAAPCANPCAHRAARRKNSGSPVGVHQGKPLFRGGGSGI